MLDRLGTREYPPSLADTLLVTVSSQQGVGDVMRELRKLNLSNKRVILGGGGAYGPATFDGLVDAICVGEGKRFLETLVRDGCDAAMRLPEAWIPGEAREVLPCYDFTWDVPPLMHPDGTVRVFGSRGCKHRCLFCQTGWEREFGQHPNPERLQRVIRHLQRTRDERIELVSNDATFDRVKLTGQHVSVRFDNLHKLMPLTRHDARSVRLGIEGISERLRSAVGKPVPNDGLLDATAKLLDARISVKWFFIVGLPGETEGDYEELRRVVMALGRLPKGCVMMNFHAFLPQPATPLGVLPLRDGYWQIFDEFRRWFFDGPGFTRRVQIIAPAQERGRLERAMQSMAATELELRRGWFEHDNQNWRVRYLAAPERLRRVARRYADRVGFKMTGGEPVLLE